MNGAESLVRTASSLGVEVCFANFGTSELNLVLALDSVSGIRPVATLFEGVCTGAADGYGRMLCKPAMSLLHLGVGLANGLGNLHNAKRARTPLLTVVGELATWHQSCDSMEATDIASLAWPVSGWVRTCQSAGAVAQDTADAIHESLKGLGSVLIVPQDCQWGECEDVPVAQKKYVRASPDQSGVKEAARLLQQTAPTLLLLGSMALTQRGLKAAQAIRIATGCDLLAETFVARMERGHGIPAVDRIPYFADQAQARLSGYKNVILAGANDPVATFGYKDGRSRFLENHQIPLHLADATQDVEHALEILADMVSVGHNHEKFHEKPQAQAQVSWAANAPLTVESAFMTIAELQPEGAIVVEEAVTCAGAYYSSTRNTPYHTLLGVTGGSIGQGMPCAVGAAIACPDRPVINVQADGSGLYSAQALWTQAREGLNITTLICSNRSYEILKVEMARCGYSNPGEAAKALTSLDHPAIDWPKLSNSMGVPGVAVASAQDLKKEMMVALNEPGPHLIEMIF